MVEVLANAYGKDDGYKQQDLGAMGSLLVV